MPGLLPAALPEPRQRRANRIDRAADGLGMRLDQIDILRVAQRLLEELLVDRRAAAECDLPRQRRRTEQVAQGATDDQGLLNLPQVRPSRFRTPRVQEGGGISRMRTAPAAASAGSFFATFRFSAVTSLTRCAAGCEHLRKACRRKRVANAHLCAADLIMDNHACR